MLLWNVCPVSQWVWQFARSVLPSPLKRGWELWWTRSRAITRKMRVGVNNQNVHNYATTIHNIIHSGNSSGQFNPHHSSSKPHSCNDSPYANIRLWLGSKRVHASIVGKPTERQCWVDEGTNENKPEFEFNMGMRTMARTKMHWNQRIQTSVRIIMNKALNWEEGVAPGKLNRNRCSSPAE